MINEATFKAPIAPRGSDVNVPHLARPRPGRSVTVVDPNALANLLGTLKADAVNSYRPAALPVGPPAARLPQRSAAAGVASNAGTPAPRSLFDTWPWSTMGKVFVGRTSSTVFPRV